MNAHPGTPHHGVEMSTTTLIGPRVKPRSQSFAARPAAVPSVLHIDGGHGWTTGQEQVRLLIRELQVMGVKQQCICPRGSVLDERLHLEGLPVRGVPWSAAADPRAMIAIARALRAYHIVHCHGGHALQITLIPAFIMHARMIATRRSPLPNRSHKWTRADRLIAMTQAVRTALLEAGVRDDRIRLIPAAIDAQEIRAIPPLQPTHRSSLGIPTGAFVAGSNAAAPARANNPIGDASCNTPGVSWITISDARALRELDVFVVPPDEIDTGPGILDAMALGIPVIAADAWGCADLLATVHEETHASLFPPDDATALAKLVCRVRSEQKLRNTMIAAQKRRIEDFHTERMAMQTLDLYREVLR